MYNFISDLLKKGRENIAKNSKQVEAGKQGILRAGNAGTIAMGKPIGACARKTLLRFKGIEIEEFGEEKEIMFDGGRANEDLWSNLLLEAKESGISLLREEEIPTRWTFLDSQGVEQVVTGRPDIVLRREGTDGNGSPILENVLLLELKQASSLWTARNVGIKLKPSAAHLIQAAHYSWQLGIPAQLWYTSRSNHAAVHDIGPIQIQWPQESSVDPDLKDRLLFNSNGYLKDVLPFMQGFEVQFTDAGQVRYRPILGAEGSRPWVSTLITIDGIKAFYKQTIEQLHTNKLAPRPAQLEANGDKASYSQCNYCPLKKTCDSSVNEETDEWLSAVKRGV